MFLFLNLQKYGKIWIGVRIMAKIISPLRCNLLASDKSHWFLFYSIYINIYAARGTPSGIVKLLNFSKYFVTY